MMNLNTLFHNDKFEEFHRMIENSKNRVASPRSKFVVTRQMSMDSLSCSSNEDAKLERILKR